MKVAITNNAKLLALFAIGCTLVVGLIDLLTRDKIAEQAQAHLLKTLHAIIDPNSVNNNLYQDCKTVNDALLGNAGEQTVYLGKMDDTPVAAAITATAPDGYNGNIALLIAINVDGSISGVRTLSHKETPGLGDKIEIRKDQWITSFNGNKVESELDSRWAVKKDGGVFDQFTGATITPRAVVNAVKKAALYFELNKDELFTSAPSCRGEK